MPNTGLKRQWPLAHIRESPLRGHPVHASWLRENRGTGAKKLRRAAKRLRIDTDETELAEEAVLLHRDCVDGRELIALRERATKHHSDERIPPRRMIQHNKQRFVAVVPTSPDLLTLAPTLNPNAGLLTGVGFGGLISSDHYVGEPFALTNGAGYTVSQGYGAYQEQIGYGHGVIDADMAVKLAQQWTTKGQTLPGELTFSTFVNHPGENVVLNIPAAGSSVVLNPRLMPGTICCAFSQPWLRSQVPPNCRLCVFFCQVSESVIS